MSNQRTPGARRASALINAHFAIGNPDKVNPRIAELIDRETRGEQVLEALKTCAEVLNELHQVRDARRAKNLGKPVTKTAEKILEALLEAQKQIHIQGIGV